VALRRLRRLLLWATVLAELAIDLARGRL